MITLYTFNTPNAQKIHIMLEETALPYRVRRVDIHKGDQFRPDFLRISPNNKIPALVDEEGPAGRPIALFESGAILLYLAEKTGRFLPAEPVARWEVLKWLFWQVGGFGPMLGQAHHFNAYAPERIPYAMERYRREANRLYDVLDGRLADRAFIVDTYSIADMAVFPWCRLHVRQGVEIADYPHVSRWFAAVAARPAVARDMERLTDTIGADTAERWSNMFGEAQYRRRDRGAA